MNQIKPPEAQWLERAGDRCRPTVVLADGTVSRGTCDWTEPRPIQENGVLFVLYYYWFLPRYLPSFIPYASTVLFSLCDRHRTTWFIHPAEAIAEWFVKEIVAKLDLDPRIPVDRDDLGQEAYLKLREKDWFHCDHGAFIQRHFDAYLMRCLKNLHTDLGRSAIANCNRETGFLETLQDIGAEAATLGGINDPMEVLRRFIADLSLEDRCIFERLLLGFSPSQTAGELKRGKTYVYYRLSWLRDALAVELGLPPKKSSVNAENRQTCSVYERKSKPGGSDPFFGQRCQQKEIEA